MSVTKVFSSKGSCPQALSNKPYWKSSWDTNCPILALHEMKTSTLRQIMVSSVLWLDSFLYGGNGRARKNVTKSLTKYAVANNDQQSEWIPNSLLFDQKGRLRKPPMSTKLRRYWGFRRLSHVFIWHILFGQLYMPGTISILVSVSNYKRCLSGMWLDILSTHCHASVGSLISDCKYLVVGSTSLTSFTLLCRFPNG